MEEPTILVATWDDGLFAVTQGGCVQEIASQPVRGLAADGRGGALAIAGGHSLLRRASGGAWARIAESAYPLSCCMAVRGTIYVGADDARMLRLHEDLGELDFMEGFDRVAGRDAWFAGSAIVNGVRMGPPLGIGPLRPMRMGAYCSPTFTWEGFRGRWMAEEAGSRRSRS
jgi:hypothetical protein